MRERAIGDKVRRVEDMKLCRIIDISIVGAGNKCSVHIYKILPSRFYPAKNQHLARWVRDHEIVDP